MGTFTEPTLLPGLKTEVDPGAGQEVRNFSTVAQVIATASRDFVDGSQLIIPPGGLKVGSKIRFVLDLTKTAAGTASAVFDISFGTAGTAADTARVSFTKIAGTAAIDVARVVIEAVVRSVSATGVVVGQFTLTHNLAATGFSTLPVGNVVTISSGFDNLPATLDPGYIGLNITSGAADVWTVQKVEASLTGV